MSAPEPEPTPARNASTSLRLSPSEPFIFQLPAIRGLRATWIPPALVSRAQLKGEPPRAQRHPAAGGQTSTLCDDASRSEAAEDPRASSPRPCEHRDVRTE